jgi:hypothetical protein
MGLLEFDLKRIIPGANRLHTWKPELNLLGLGVAIAALVFSYEVPETPGQWDSGLVAIFSIAAAWLLISGALNKIPTADVDERWDDRYDRLRNLTEAVQPTLSAFYINNIWAHNDSVGTWEEYTKLVAIPHPDARPLHLWGPFLKNHESEHVREFFRFAGMVNEAQRVSDYRRFAVRTYHRFGRLLRADADGFREWFNDEGVKDGAEPIVVLMAYLEVARAARHPTGFRGDGHSGFWYLARRWHPNTMRLPKSIQPESKKPVALPPNAEIPLTATEQASKDTAKP